MIVQRLRSSEGRERENKERKTQDKVEGTYEYDNAEKLISNNKCQGLSI